MSLEIKIILVLIFLVIILFALWRRAASHRDQIAFQKSSLSSKYGKMSEQFMPFLKDFPFDPQNFRFIGSPIDGVQFDDDKIVLIEFKTNSSQMTERQRRIAELVFQKKVFFEEHRID